MPEFSLGQAPAANSQNSPYRTEGLAGSSLRRLQFGGNPLPLRRPTGPPALPEVAPNVRRDDVEACGEAESDAGEEGIGKTDADEIEIALGLKKLAHGGEGVLESGSSESPATSASASRRAASS